MLRLIKYLIIIVLFHSNLILAKVALKTTQITTDNGLSQNSIRVIYEDHLGYLWIGTQDGLNKFDGYQFHIFRNNPADSTTINNNSITSIYEDKNNTIWVGTITGLNRLDKNSNRFKSYPFWDVDYIASLPSKFYRSLYQKYLLLATGTGLFLFDKDNGERRRVSIPSSNNIEFAKSHVYWYAWQPNSLQPILWAATTNNGLWRVRFSGLKAIKSTRFSLQINSGRHGVEPEIFNLLFQNDTLWISCKTGLFFLNTKLDNPNIRIWQPDGKTNFFFGKSIRFFLIDHQGNYWIGSMKNGLYYYLSKERALQKINDEAIFSIFQDQFHSVWVGTSGAGIFKYNLDEIIFHTYRLFSEEKTNSHRNHIWAIYQDSTGLVWLGTNYGIKFFNRLKNNHKQSTYKTELLKRFYVLKNTQVRNIVPDKKGNIWIGTLGNGLFQYRLYDNKLFHYKHIPSDSNSISGNLIYKLYIDNKQNLWVGMNITGLSKAIYHNGKIKYFKNYSKLRKNYSNNNLWILDIVETPEDSGKFLWLASWERGLIHFNKKTGLGKIFGAQTPNGLNCNYLLSLYYSNRKNDSVLWIGTYGGGLNKFNLKTHKCKYYTTNQGLANNVIYAIEEDNEGKLWLSTNNGLSCFDVKDEKFINYNKEDGLQSTEFNLQASFKNSSGELFFGGVNGLNYFKPMNAINRIPPNLDITRITVFQKNGTKIIKKLLNGTLHLSYNQNSFQIEFVALHSKNPKKQHYAYQLANWGKEWITTGNQRKVMFINLPPGNYYFKVRACNSDGIWNKKAHIIHIVISPPFWKTKLAFTIYFLILVSLFYLFHRIKIKEALKIERIKAQERLQVKKDIEFDFHDELGIRITKIIQFSNKLKFQNHFLNNDGKQLIDKIYRQAHELDSELNEFLWEIDSSEDTLEDMIIQLKNCSENFFEETAINFNIQNQIEKSSEIKLPFKWRRNIVKIFKEGMHNVLKHAKHCKNVNLSFILKNSTLHIILTDDGEGFDLNKVKQGKGLKSMQKRAQAINAEIHIHSQKGQGTSLHLEGKLT